MTLRLPAPLQVLPESILKGKNPLTDQLARLGLSAGSLVLSTVNISLDGCPHDACAFVVGHRHDPDTVGMLFVDCALLPRPASVPLQDSNKKPGKPKHAPLEPASSCSPFTFIPLMPFC